MASTQIITDLKSSAAATPTAASQALALAAAGPIGDLQGMLSLALLKAQELKQLLATILGTNPGGAVMIDNSDPIKTTLTGVSQSLV